MQHLKSEKINGTPYRRRSFLAQSTSELQDWLAAMVPDRELPPTHRLSITQDGPMEFSIGPVPIETPIVRAEGEPSKPSAPSLPDEVVSRARALETWKREDLETRAVELSLKYKKNATLPTLAAMIAQAEHDAKEAK